MAQDLLENCSVCYQFALSEFPIVLTIEGNLDPTKEYYFKFTDKFNNSYVTGAITPDADGIVTIQVVTVDPDTTSFIEPIPSPAWFNKNAGLFTIEASLETDLWTPEEFAFDGVTYQCIVVEFFNDNSEKSVIK